MHILVVEDEVKVAALIQNSLESDGFTVETCHHGNEAFARATGREFAAIILDIMLPGSDGLSILRKLRAGRTIVPVLLLSARGEVADRVNGLNQGADDYLAKPFSPTELVARVHALLRRRSGLTMHVLTYADLTVNLLTREVRRRDHILELTPREFALLEYFLSSPDRVVTRTEISQQIWGYQLDPGTNVVDVVVQRLRRKLDAANPTPLIQTVRGVGYLLHAAP